MLKLFDNEIDEGGDIGYVDGAVGVVRNVFGSRAICATRLPRASSCSIWSICDPRRLTSASSVPANTEPSSRKMKIRRMFKPSDMIPI